MHYKKEVYITYVVRKSIHYKKEAYIVYIIMSPIFSNYVLYKRSVPDGSKVRLNG